MNRNTLITVTLVLLLGFGLAIAQPPSSSMPPKHPEMKGPGHWMMDDNDCTPKMRGMMGGLNLNDEQKMQVEKMGLAHQKNMIEMRSETAGLKDKLKLIMTSDKFKQKDADKIIDKLSDSRASHMKAKVAHMREVRNILTPEQKIKFDKRILSGKGGVSDGHHKGMKGGKGHKGPHGKKGPRGMCR
jgi:Spy/CpxP family protein refolding chaperone